MPPMIMKSRRTREEIITALQRRGLTTGAGHILGREDALSATACCRDYLSNLMIAQMAQRFLPIRYCEKIDHHPARQHGISARVY